MSFYLEKREVNRFEKMPPRPNRTGEKRKGTERQANVPRPRIAVNQAKTAPQMQRVDWGVISLACGAGTCLPRGGERRYAPKSPR